MIATRRVLRWELWWPGKVCGLTWRQRRRMSRIGRNAARAGARIALARRDVSNVRDALARLDGEDGDG